MNISCYTHTHLFIYIYIYIKGYAAAADPARIRGTSLGALASKSEHVNMVRAALASQVGSGFVHGPCLFRPGSAVDKSRGQL